MRAAAELATCVVLVLGGCGDGKPDPSPIKAKADLPTSGEPVKCGEGGETFVDYGFVPRGVRAAVRVRLGDAALDESVAALAKAARADGHGLPIDVAFALGEWSWQLPLVRSTLERGGHYPGELVYLHMGGGVSAWAWPSSCDLDTHTQAADVGWSVAVKHSEYGAVARGSAKGGFAFDVLYYRGAFVALAPAGKSSAVAQKMSANPSGADLPNPAEVLGSADAPIHIVLTGRALIAPSAPAQGDPLRQLVATPAGLKPAP